MLYTCIYYLINNKMWSQTINQNVGRQNLYTIIKKSLISPVDQFGKCGTFPLKVAKSANSPHISHCSGTVGPYAVRSAWKDRLEVAYSIGPSC